MIMADTQGSYNHEDEIRGMYVNMGNEVTNSNGHGEGKEENMNLVEFSYNNGYQASLNMRPFEALYGRR
jgi:hypothetical protein